MLMEQTLEKMNQMKLSAMVEALEQQRRSNQYTDLGFEERLGLRVDEEWTAREHRKLTRRLRAAKLRYATASLENVDFKHRRRLDRSQVLALGSESSPFLVETLHGSRWVTQPSSSNSSTCSPQSSVLA